METFQHRERGQKRPTCGHTYGDNNADVEVRAELGKTSKVLPLPSLLRSSQEKRPQKQWCGSLLYLLWPFNKRLSLLGREGEAHFATIFGPQPQRPNTAGSHLHRALAAVLAEIFNITRAGLAQPAGNSEPQGMCTGRLLTFSGRQRPQSFRAQPRNHIEHQMLGPLPGTSLNQEGTSPQQPPPLGRSRPAAILKSPTFQQDLPPTTPHPPEGRNKWTLGWAMNAAAHTGNRTQKV